MWLTKTSFLSCEEEILYDPVLKAWEQYETLATFYSSFPYKTCCTNVYTPRNFYFASQYHIIINSNKWKSYEFYTISYINVYNEKGMERIFMQQRRNTIFVFRIILWYYGFHIYLNENKTTFLLKLMLQNIKEAWFTSNTFGPWFTSRNCDWLS